MKNIYHPHNGGSSCLFVLCSTLDFATDSHDGHGLTAGQLFTYRIAAVNTRGVESDPVVVGN
jgi:hypothetical protein